LPGIAGIWEEARRVHRAVMMEVLELEPAWVAAVYASLVSPFTSPVLVVVYALTLISTTSLLTLTPPP